MVSQPYKQVDIGQAVILDDAFLSQNNHVLKMQAQTQAILEEAANKAESILSDALKEAEKLLAETQESAFSQRDAVLKEGYDEGYQAGYAQASIEIKDKLESADTIVQKAFAVESELIRSHQTIVCDLLKLILNRILNDTFTAQPQQWGNILSQALDKFQITSEAKVILNSQTLQNLRHFSPETLQTFETLQQITFEGDPNCGPLAMYLQALNITYDLSPATQVDVLVNAIEPLIHD